jgi:hypothetical protein
MANSFLNIAFLVLWSIVRIASTDRHTKVASRTRKPGAGSRSALSRSQHRLATSVALGDSKRLHPGGDGSTTFQSFGS